MKWKISPLALLLAAGTARAQGYIQHNLVSDVPGLAAFTDPNLVNAWGIASSPSGPIWVANNGTGTSTVYNGNGTARPLVVTIPAAPGSTEGGVPTGLVFNGTGQFTVSQGGKSGSALFIFAGEDGTVSGWNPGVSVTNAIRAVDNSARGAIYKGIALGSAGGANYIYLADFHNAKVDTFDSSFTPVGGFSFTDLNLPAGYAPFGIANIGGNLYVSYALQDADKEDDVAGPGNGFVDEYDTTGVLMRQFATQGTLNSPWGMTMAPEGFGAFGGAILVGNFGDGRINAFDPASGDFLGQFENPDGSPLEIDGLWGLLFGNGGSGGRTDNLYFTAGPDDESHGLLGRIQAIPAVAVIGGKS
jgi:uncharacterized protein (TIGR03118 family)